GGQVQPAIIAENFAVGGGSGGTAVEYDASRTPIQVFSPGAANYPFAPNYTGSVRTSVADFNLDGVADVALGSGPGIRAQVAVLDGRTGNPLFNLFPFEEFTGGVFVTAGGISGDGYPSLII